MSDAAYSAAVTQLAWTLVVFVAFVGALLAAAWVREWCWPRWRERKWIRRLRRNEAGRKAQARQ